MEKYQVAYVPSKPTDAEEPNDRSSAATSSIVSRDAYKKMCASLYAYRFGTIGFLDLLATFEEILAIESPQTDV